MKKTKKYGFIIFLTFLALFIAARSQPLEDVHWDSPGYIWMAKSFAETNLLASYYNHSKEISEEIRDDWPDERPYSESYWRFSRIGNVIILGLIVKLLGATTNAITILIFLYTILLIIGVVSLFFILFDFKEVEDKTQAWFSGGVISILLFLISDIYSYLAGNLISEIPALFFLCASVLLLQNSIRKRNLILAILAGSLAFVIYVIRVDSVWTWLSFLIAYLLTQIRPEDKHIQIKSLLTAGSTALLFFIGYVVTFYPLTDPGNFIDFAIGQSGTDGGIPTYQLVFAVGGLMWIGALASIKLVKKSKLVLFGWVWLGLSILPFVPQIVLSFPCQIRMMTLLIPPIFLLSSAGWAMLVRENRRPSLSFAVTISVCLALVSQPYVYKLMINLPAVWRIQSIKNFLYAPKAERKQFFYKDMEKVAKVIYNTKEPAILFYDGSDFVEDNLYLVRFFGPPYPLGADIANFFGPSRLSDCEKMYPSKIDPVLFCAVNSQSRGTYVHPEIERKFRIYRVEDHNIPSKGLLLKSGQFLLFE